MTSAELRAGEQTFYFVEKGCRTRKEQRASVTVVPYDTEELPMSERVLCVDDLDHVIHVLVLRANAARKKLAAENGDSERSEIRRNIYRLILLRDAIRVDKPSGFFH